jgi:phage shock protein PspC (stress-responsive transcriptional regulator)
MKRLYRSQQDKKIAGICGGLGEMFGIDAALIRLAVVFVAGLLVLIYRSAVGILPILIAYAAAWIIVPAAPAQPEAPERMPLRRLYRSPTDKKIAGICGGLGEMFSVDATLIRLALVFVALVTAIVPLLIAYLVGWIIIPLAPRSQG